MQIRSNASQRPEMKKLILTSLLIFVFETVLHTLIIALWPKKLIYDPVLYGGAYLKMKVLFYLLSYIIAHTYLLQRKKHKNRLIFGLVQVCLFVSLTILFFPITGMLTAYLLTFEIIFVFLLISFITPFIILKISDSYQ